MWLFQWICQADRNPFGHDFKVKMEDFFYLMSKIRWKESQRKNKFFFIFFKNKKIA